MAESVQKPGLKRWFVAAAAVALVAVMLVASGAFKKADLSTASSPTFAVKRGQLTISVSEPGTIKSRNLEVIKSEVEGQTTILWLVQEGTQVKKGDLLVELDASKLQDQRVDKQIAVQNAEANFIRSREQLEVTKNQTQADIAKAKLDYQFASEDLVKYEQGDYPTSKKEAEARLSLARDELAQKTEKSKQSKELYEKAFTSLSEVQADELAVKRAQNELESAREQLTLLESFTHKRRLAELRSNLDQTRMALERVTRKASADIVQSEAELRAKESEFERQKSQLAKIIKQIERTKMYAPTDGLVVYATTGQSNMRSNAEPLAEGATVRERQDIIYLPTSNSVMAEVKLHESTLDRVRPGLPVRITVDALPGKVYSGSVAKIAPLPDGQSMWMNPDMKVFNSEIHLEANDDALRTGMSCRAEIVVETHADAVYVPVQAVLRVNGVPTVYIKNGDKLEPRRIDVGLDNNRMAHVRSGLEAGESVVLNPPLADAAALADQGPPPAPVKVPETPKKAPPATASLPEPQTSAKTAEVVPQPVAEARTPDAGTQTGEERRGRRGNMTPEQREEMRKRMESMSPEEREKMREQWMQRRQQQGGNSEGGARERGARE
ncbi:MAG TPA: efflux RND transporter periplasmic adaptor subunit [Planctomycetota bacterium]|nr:efflux RND transporter periplasmic adaptor subunit [Planctomycetota bacterium]